MAIDLDTLHVGLAIPEWSRLGSFHHWNRWAAVNGDFSDHHMDDEAGRHEGFEGAFIMAPLSHAYLHAMLREWMGEQGRIIAVDMRLKHPLFRNRWLTAGAEISSIRQEQTETVVELDFWQKDDLGRQLGLGTATVALRNPPERKQQ